MNTPQFLRLPIDTNAQFNSLGAKVKSIWQRCIWAISGNLEPKVWQEVDAQGQIVAWHVYDPASGQKNCFGSELEVRYWLEGQYNR